MTATPSARGRHTSLNQVLEMNCTHACQGASVGSQRPGYTVGPDVTTFGERHEASGGGVAQDAFELVGVGAGGCRQVPHRSG